ncbi:MAG: sugar phosphate isomerase/epimerase [Phycisphaeraceae bacterium]|nr:sugar phosphate isomerase/epimerase [Phycisphaeraceae bacterium]
MSRRYSVILGNLGNTKDRFCGGYKDNPDTAAMLRQAAGIPHVQGIELVGTWDITPDNAKQMKGLLGDLGKVCTSIIPDLFADKRFWKGSYSSADPAVRRYAIDYTRRLCDVALSINCPLLNIWPGQDGYDYLLTADYDSARSWFRDGLIEIAQAYPQLRFALEYKPKEPRCRSYLATMADTLLMCLETGCANVGVCIDTGHSYVAQESVGEAIVLARRAGGGYPDTAGRLFHMHFNDNHGHWDDDMIVGSVHSSTYVETLYWLDRCGYAGWLSMDQYPYREDAVGAISESILWLRQFDDIVQRHRARIDALLTAGDAVATSRFLRSALGPSAGMPQ